MKFKPLIASLMFLALTQSVSADNFFTECRFHYGAGNASGTLLNDIDYMVAWAGSSQSFNLGSFFTNCKNNNKTPGAYLLHHRVYRAGGFRASRTAMWERQALVPAGRQFHTRTTCRTILSVYATYAKGAEQTFGSANKMIWCMEPDYEQYSENGQPEAVLTPAQCGTVYGGNT